MDISSLKILIAEDNQMNILLMKKLLAKWDIVPDFAANGMEAVETFRSKSYNLILMDIHMPLLNGYEATELIRNDADPIKAKTPIIALTAAVDSTIESEIKAAGLDDYIAKPFNAEELKQKLMVIADGL
ncbi:MAG: response regulator [Pedobacter sp.]|nr:response regulator [Pedobacter sp.]